MKSLFTLLLLSAGLALNAQNFPEPFDYVEAATSQWDPVNQVWGDTFELVNARDSSSLIREEISLTDQNGSFEAYSGVWVFRTGDTIDSIIEFDIDPSVGTTIQQKEVNFYVNGKQVEYQRSSYDPIFNAWTMNARTRWNYDGQGRLSSKVNYGLTLTGGLYLFIVNDSSGYFYDNSTLADSLRNWGYNGTVWVEQRRERYTYDNNGNLTFVSPRVFNPLFPGWVNTERTHYIYDGQDRQIEIETQGFSNGQYTAYFSVQTRYNALNNKPDSILSYSISQMDTVYTLVQAEVYGYTTDTLIETRRYGFMLNPATRTTYNYNVPMIPDPVDTTDTVSGVAFHDWSSKSVAMFPNPAADGVYFSTSDGSNIHAIEVMDIQGQVMYRTDGSTGNQQVLSVAKLPAGTYVCRVFLSNGKVATKRLVH